MKTTTSTLRDVLHMLGASKVTGYNTDETALTLAKDLEMCDPNYLNSAAVATIRYSEGSSFADIFVTNEDETYIFEVLEYNRRSFEEIEGLKKAWLDDGIWDIEDTEGFELYYHDLKAFSEKFYSDREAKIQAAHIDSVEAIMSEMPGTTFGAAEYILKLQNNIARLENRLINVEFIMEND